ncbi:MAG: competence protein CoiA family protein [Rhabdochlamydiaceae bacterium]|nr:competence protein CoiA family protein [Candidatus Amphrikana amoebophyrae]
MQKQAFLGFTLISIEEAVKGIDYKCPECHTLLRFKKGVYYKPHFYHVNGQSCSKNGAEHIAVQARIKKLIPSAQLEKAFNQVQRIADVCYEEKKIIFEVQCSPITAEELLARNRDYEAMDYTVIWIFHTKRYNRGRLKPSEKIARNQLAYYTDITAGGKGQIFDMAGFGRSFLAKREKYPVDLSRVKECSNIRAPKTLFKTLKKRLLQKYYFSGDLLDLAIHEILYLRVKKESAGFNLMFEKFLEWVSL